MKLTLVFVRMWKILSFLKDKGKLGAVVEFVLSGSKVKIHIPKEVWSLTLVRWMLAMY